MNQCRRVLRALQRHPDGITAVDFLLPNVVDGHPPITRLAARIKDLRDQGHRIVVDGERHGCAVYVLERDVVAAASPTEGDPMSSARLECPPPVKMRQGRGSLPTGTPPPAHHADTLFTPPPPRPASPYDEAA